MRFLFVDRITALVPGVTIQGLKHVSHDDYYLQQDTLGNWCFIPSLLGETLGQLAAWNVMMTRDFTVRPVAGIVSSAVFYRTPRVGETLSLDATIDNLDDTAVLYHGDVRVGDEVVFRLDGALGPLLPMADFIDDAVVKRQFAEINRPALLPSSPLLQPSMAASGAHAAPMVFDDIVAYEPGVSLRAVKLVTRAASYFADHFPHKPVLPMSVLIECFIDLAQELLTRSGIDIISVAKTLRRMKMTDFIYPGDVVDGLVTLKRQETNEVAVLCRAEVNGKRIGVLEIIFSANEA
jgi:3-hydroxymyristoyl/3-hydroxydecanoyl-(acyl carrier protein) dehydratase